MTVMTREIAYRRGWERSRHYDDSEEDFFKCRARFEKKWATWVDAWEEGWMDAAGSGSYVQRWGNR